jgi:peptide/nickel transport system permease protein
MVQETAIRRSERAAYLQELRYALSLLLKNKLVFAGLLMSLFFIVVAALANVLVNPDEALSLNYSYAYCWSNPYLNWGTQSPSCPANSNEGQLIINPLYAFPYALGGDGYGRDLLHMIVLALPLDLKVALTIVALATVIGVLIGSIAAYLGGLFDEVILRITDIFFAFPTLVLALVFAVLLGRNIQSLELALLLVWWPPYVRLIRGQVLVEKEKAYAEALRALGIGRLRLLLLHLIPNSIFPVLVQATLDIGGVILVFSALMFLGFSPNPALPELGNLASEGITHVFTAPWLIVFPGLAILLVSLAFNLVGDGLRDVLDPRLRR